MFRALLFSSICYSFSNGNFSAAIVNLIRQLDSPIVRKGSDDSVVVDRSIRHAQSSLVPFNIGINFTQLVCNNCNFWMERADEKRIGCRCVAVMAYFE